jgi:hypothetical protein
VAIVTYGMLRESYPEEFDCTASQPVQRRWEDLSELAEDIFCEDWGDRRSKIITYWLLAQKQLQDIATDTQNGIVQSMRVDDEMTVSFFQQSTSNSKGWMSDLEKTYYGRIVLAMYKTRYPMGQYYSGTPVVSFGVGDYYA